MVGPELGPHCILCSMEGSWVGFFGLSDEFIPGLAKAISGPGISHS